MNVEGWWLWILWLLVHEVNVSLDESVRLVYWALMIHVLTVLLPPWPLLVQSDFLNEVNGLISLYVYPSSLLGVVRHFDLDLAVEYGVSHWFETIQLLYYFFRVPWSQSPLWFTTQVFLFICALACRIIVKREAWSLVGWFGFSIGDAREWAFAELIVDHFMDDVLKTLMKGLLLRSALQTPFVGVVYL